MAYIYKITNNINGKIYIGKTERDITKRFKEHCADSLREDCQNRPLYLAMRKYGVSNFYIELIEETSNPEEREIFWIEKLQSFKYGYNATHGGDGQKYVDYEPIIALYQQGYHMSQIAKIIKCDFRTVERALDSVKIYSKKRLQRYRESTYRMVAKIDKDSGEILDIYKSVSEAERENSIPRHVGQVCSGKRKTAGGYKWRYVPIEDKI